MRMVRQVLALLLILAVLAPARADSRRQAADQGPYLGVLFSPVAEARFLHNCQRLARPFLGPLAAPLDHLADQLPPLPGVRGVLVTEVIPDSPAHKVGLKPGDVILRYNDAPLHDCRDLVRLIQADKPEHKVHLVYVRDRKEATAEATLVLGPVLRLAPAYSTFKKGNNDGPRATTKPLPPSSVSVAVGPLPDGKMKVIIEYFDKDAGEARTVTCKGSTKEIEAEVNRLPARERNLVRRALDRLLNPPADKPSQR